MNDGPDTAHGPRSDGRPRRRVSEQSLRDILDEALSEEER